MSGETFTLLVIDDSPTMRQLMVFALKRIHGIRVVEAGDGIEGLKKLGQEKFDLILTDINMPVMDGLKLVSLVRNHPVYNGIPIIVITTEGGSEDRNRAMDLGANDYITKPVQPTAVLAAVKRVLNI